MLEIPDLATPCEVIELGKLDADLQRARGHGDIETVPVAARGRVD